MPRVNRKRKTEDRAFRHDKHFYCDDRTLAEFDFVMREGSYGSDSACVRSLIHEKYKSLTNPESYGVAVGLKGSTPQSGIE